LWDSPPFEPVVKNESYGRPPYFVRIGGGLPITDVFLRELNAYTVMIGFGLDDECIHSPNEFMRLASFERGQIVYAGVLQRLAEVAPAKLSAR
jgi:acetylornithine deacetylase/succinyl-diaminopimelate desuccinylase-like protein